MFQSRLLKIAANCLQLQNGKWLSSAFQLRKHLIYPMNKGQIRVLRDIFGLDYTKAYKISRKHTNLRTMNQISLYKSAAMLKRFGITREDLLEYPQLLSMLAVTIENYAMILEEAGFTSIRPAHLLNFLTMTGKPVKLIKAYGYIPQEVELDKHFFTHLKDPPPPLEFPNSDDREFSEVYSAAFCHYLCWRLEMSKEDLERLMLIYTRLKRRSFRLVESSLNILETEVGFTKDKIKRNGYLIHSHAENTMNILKTIKSLGGIDLKSLVHRHPKIIAMSLDTLLKTDHYLKEFEIPDSAIQRCPDVYTLSSETVNERLKALQNVPEFMGLIKNPRVVRLVHYQNKACSRLKHLENIKFKCASLHLLQSSKPVFDKFLRDGNNRTHGNDIMEFLSTELERDKEEIRKLLHRHPFWCNVPLVTVHETLNFLRDKGYTKEQIFKNIHILLYPSKQLEKHLNELTYHPEIRKEMLRQKELGNEYEMEFSPEQQLALALYFIERDHHFSGDGIWFDNPHIVTSDDVAA